MSKDAPIYTALVPLEGVGPQLVTFGGKVRGTTYADGVVAESHFTVNRYLWEVAGEPKEIAIAFSADPDFLTRHHKEARVDYETPFGALVTGEVLWTSNPRHVENGAPPSGVHCNIATDEPMDVVWVLVKLDESKEEPMDEKKVTKLYELERDDAIPFTRAGFTPSMSSTCLFLEMHETGAGLGMRMVDEHTVGVFRADPDGSERPVYMMWCDGSEVGQDGPSADEGALGTEGQLAATEAADADMT